MGERVLHAPSRQSVCREVVIIFETVTFLQLSPLGPGAAIAVNKRQPTGMAAGLLNRRAASQNLSYPTANAPEARPDQLINLRSRTLFTSPSNIKVVN